MPSPAPTTATHRSILPSLLSQKYVIEFRSPASKIPNHSSGPRTADQILDSLARYARRTLAAHPSRINSRTNGTGD